jgi:enoyl-CoA hydratase/carnithine racemase
MLLGANDFSADLAERYSWINRALPDAELAPFVSALAHRISRFPLTGIADPKQRVNDIALPDVAARPVPESACSASHRPLTVRLTDDTHAARANAAERFALYGRLPSYRAMLDREGVRRPPRCRPHR